MSLPVPFAYPATQHTPVHAPSGYTDYSRYKPWLRDEFAFRCVYCLTRERWGSSVSGHAEFGADHIVPKSAMPALVTSYTNLIYSCNDCNRYKLTASLPINPLTEPLGKHLQVSDDGTISALTVEGQDFIDLFDLDSPGRVRLRSDRLTILRLKVSFPDDPDVDVVYRRAFGYPDDLPDLSRLEPPGGNAFKGSEQKSHYARHHRGELPDVY